MRPTTQRHRRGLTVGVCAAVLALAGPGGTAAGQEELDQTIEADQEVAAGTAELERGHVDIGPRFVDGTWTLLIHDDTARETGDGTSVWRRPDRTVLRVSDASVLTVPEGDDFAFLGLPAGQDVHVVPQTQHPDVVWVGWNTQDPEVMASIDRGVTLSLLGVDGPGDLLVYLQSGSFDEPDVLWDSRTVEPQPAWIDVNTHAHANWVFSDPGVYLVRMQVSAQLLDGSEVADTHTVRFAVGDTTSAEEALAAEEPGEPAGAAPVEEDATAAGAEPGAGGVDGPPVAALVVGAVALLLIVAGAFAAVRARRAKRQGLTGAVGR